MNLLECRSSHPEYTAEALVDPLVHVFLNGADACTGCFRADVEAGEVWVYLRGQDGKTFAEPDPDCPGSFRPAQAVRKGDVKIFRSLLPEHPPLQAGL